MASPEMTVHAERQRVLTVDIAERVAAARVEMLEAMTGRHDPERVRRGMIEFDPNSGERRYRPRESPGLQLLTRCHRLVATINGTPKRGPDRSAALQKWMAAALRESTD
jgi:hypothetical protein